MLGEFSCAHNDISWIRTCADTHACSHIPRILNTANSHQQDRHGGAEEVEWAYFQVKQPFCLTGWNELGFWSRSTGKKWLEISLNTVKTQPPYLPMSGHVHDRNGHLCAVYNHSILTWWAWKWSSFVSYLCFRIDILWKKSLKMHVETGKETRNSFFHAAGMLRLPLFCYYVCSYLWISVRIPQSLL